MCAGKEVLEKEDETLIRIKEIKNAIFFNPILAILSRVSEKKRKKEHNQRGQIEKKNLQH